MESGLELGITCSDTMRNYQLSKKLKLLGYGEFNHLTNILTIEVMVRRFWWATTPRARKFTWLIRDPCANQKPVGGWASGTSRNSMKQSWANSFGV
jgi:hypothetical protein